MFRGSDELDRNGLWRSGERDELRVRYKLWRSGERDDFESGTNYAGVERGMNWVQIMERWREG